MILGWRDGAPFAHCHGLFQDAAGHLACGHLRVESCMLGAGVVLTGHAWRGAAFVAQPCRETNFVLLTPVSLYTVTANAAIVKLSPNQDIGAALTDAAAARGLGDATVLGLGSLVGAQRLERIETEFFFDQARLQAGAADLNVTVVEAGGRRLSGHLAHGENAVLMTVEALLISSPDASSESCRR
jgi:predicted DNA-binding protein with PD1-like motif